MAGFGALLAALIFGFAGIAGAGALAAILFFFARKKLRDEGRSDRSFVVRNIVAPFLGLAWLVVALVIHVEISNNLAHQDCGFSTDPYVTLPNGYEVGSYNRDEGYIKAPGAQLDVPVAGPGYVRSIVTLHLFGERFTGTQFDFKTSSVRRFTFDTRTQAFQSVVDEHPLSWEDAKDRAQLDEESYWKIYAMYMHYWPYCILLILVAGGEGAIALWVRRAWIKQPSL